MSEARVRAAFRQQGEWCAELGSPFMARLMAGATGCAGLSAAAMVAIARNDDRILPWIDLHSQTNEVARPGALALRISR